jgi:hypothetical protein
VGRFRRKYSPNNVYNLPWFNRSLRRQTRNKQRLYNKAKHWNEFRAARKRLHISYISNLYLKFSRKCIEENPKRFWSYIKQLKNDDPGVADFKVGNLKSEILSEQFSSVFTDENLTDIPSVGLDPKRGIGAITVTIPGVIKQLTCSKLNWDFPK